MKKFYKISNIKVNLYITVDLKTILHNEIFNLKMWRYFYIVINLWEDKLLGRLAIAKFAANNNQLVFTKLFRFFAIKSLHCYISFDKVKLSITRICEQIFHQKTLDISQKMQITLEFTSKTLATT